MASGSTYFGLSSSSYDTYFTSFYDKIVFGYFTTPSDGDGHIKQWACQFFSQYQDNGYVNFALYESSNRELVAQSTTVNVNIYSNSSAWVTANPLYGCSSISADTDYILTVWGDESLDSTYPCGTWGWQGLIDADHSASGNGDYTNYVPLPPEDDTAIVTPMISLSYDYYYPGPKQPSANTYNGCIVSSNSKATLTGKMMEGSGTCWIYVLDMSAPAYWDYSSNIGTVYAGEDFEETFYGLSKGQQYYYEVHASSNGWGGGEFESPGVYFTTTNNEDKVEEGGSMRIYYSTNSYPNFYIDTWCTRWDEGNWDITLETFMNSSNRGKLFRHIIPGAVKELYNILGTPTYIDTTYSSSNTLFLEPLHTYGLSSVRWRREIAVKSISDTFINWDWFGIKIEGMRLDT